MSAPASETAGNLIQLFVRGFKGGTSTIDIHKDAQIADLFRKLEDKTGLKPGAYQLVYVSKTIDYEQHKGMHLNEFHLETKANLFMVLRLYGGANMKELDDCVELTDLPDMITWDDDHENKRAKMPCGHAIGPESLTSYCRSLLGAGKFRFMCPWVDRSNASVGCTAEWPYVVVRRLAVLTGAEKREFERRISENYLRRAQNIQDCPGCKSFCLRRSVKDRRMICPVCSTPGKDFEFCWYCLNKWRDPGKEKCGNEICSGKDPRVAILASAPEKEIVGVKGVPGRRACIKCGILIEHMRACKHMECICEQEFCFICLKPKLNGAWQCGSYSSPCTVAPRQTELPGN